MNTATIPGLDELRKQLEETSAPDVPYTPTITTIHLPIDCKLYRVPGIKTGRGHHLLGRPEYIRFLKEDMGESLNIREQFGVPLEMSVHFANIMNIRHPYVWQEKRLAQMTVDLVLTNTDGTWTALDCKPADKLKQKRASNKLKLMAAIMESVGVPHHICTDKDIPEVTQENYEILHPLALPFDPPPFSQGDMQRVGSVMRRLLQDGTRAIREAASLCEMETGLNRGLSIRAAQWLIANNHWQVDLAFKIAADEPLSFLR